MEKIQYTYDEALTASVEYFNGDELGAKVFVDKYALTDNDGHCLEKTPADMHRRLARELARKDKEKFKQEAISEEEIFSYLDKFRYIVPQGGILYGLGNPYQYVSLGNCFVPGTKVYTTSGVKNIEDVNIDDKVVTHDGTLQNVKQLHKNPLNGRQLYTIKCYHTPSVTVTGNHKFLSISKEQIGWQEKPQWNTIEYLRNGDFIAIPHKTEYDNYIGEIDIRDIFPQDDYEINTRKYQIETNNEFIQLITLWTNNKNHDKYNRRLHSPVKRRWSIDKDFAYFLGLWYGDGCIFSNSSAKNLPSRSHKARTTNYCVKGITFTFGAHEKEIIDFVSCYGEKLFGLKPDVNYHNVNKDGSVQIVFNSVLVAMVFEKLFGRYCDGKKMYTEVFAWPNELIKNMLQGIVDSDGCITSYRKAITVVMNNYKFLDDVYNLARALGYSVGLTKCIESDKKNYGRLSFDVDCDLADNSRKYYDDDRISRIANVNQQSRAKHTINIDGYTLVKINKKTKCNMTPEYVYTLGIENNHSYTVEGLICQNCFVVRSPDDSFSSILYTDAQIVHALRRRGGIGVNISKLRPNGTSTKNAAKTSSGPVSFLHRYSDSIRNVCINGRRGAGLACMSVHHPDILEFITCKKDLTKITGMNLSIQFTDEFFSALKQQKTYELRWPVDSKTPQISKQQNAQALWDIFIQNTRDQAEPGALFWDTVLRESPSDCYEEFRSVSTNVCGEQNLSEYDSCRLLLVNVFSFVDNPFTTKATFNWSKFYKICSIAQRLMDNIVDLELEQVHRIISKIESDPEPNYVKQSELDFWLHVYDKCENGRRTGTGMTGVGDVLAALGIKYDSNKGLKIIERIYKTMKFACYEASVDVAEKLGPFPSFDASLEVTCPFFQRFYDEECILSDSITVRGSDIMNKMKKYGRRNVALLTASPAGSMSILTQTTSGIEPLFMMSYTRRKKGNPNDKDFRVDYTDKNGDAWMQFDAIHPKLQTWMEITGETDISKSPYADSCAESLDYIQRVKIQAAIQKHICSNISSTVNLPHNITIEEVDKIYKTAYKLGTKGITIYRKGCRDGVIIDRTDAPLDNKKPQGIIVHDRPRVLPCDVHHTTIDGREYFVLVGLLNGKPYEVFSGKNGCISKTVKTGTIKRKRKNFYIATFDGTDDELSPITASTNEMEEAISRLTSLALRSGSEMHRVVQQLEKVGEKTTLHSFARGIARVLKKYIPDGTLEGEKCPECNSEIMRQEGCLLCKSCGYSKCL
jgi:ribonucleoside-diphosphate reductase alpha chain